MAEGFFFVSLPPACFSGVLHPKWVLGVVVPVEREIPAVVSRLVPTYVYRRLSAGRHPCGGAAGVRAEHPLIHLRCKQPPSVLSLLIIGSAFFEKCTAPSCDFQYATIGTLLFYPVLPER